MRDYGIPPSNWPEVTYTPMSGLPSITVPAWTGCLGLEPTPEMFVAHIVLVYREVWRVLRDDGTIWVNFGDSYASSTSNKNDEKWGDPKNTGKGGRRCRTNALKPKDLIGIPWRVAFALQADGWYLRMDNIWNKPNPMPESVTDRPTKAHEYFFLLSKSKHYYYDKEAIMEPLAESSIARLAQDIENQDGSSRANGGAKTNGNTKAVRSGNTERKYGEDRDRPGSHLGASIPWEGMMRNKRSVWKVDDPMEMWHWLYGKLGDEAYKLFLDYMIERNNLSSVWTIPTAHFSEAHFAIFPDEIPRIAILAGCPVGGSVLDPFGGSGTTRKVALQNNRECTSIEIKHEYIEIQKRRTAVIQTNLF